MAWKDSFLKTSELEAMMTEGFSAYVVQKAFRNVLARSKAGVLKINFFSSLPTLQKVFLSAMVEVSLERCGILYFRSKSGSRSRSSSYLTP